MWQKFTIHNDGDLPIATGRRIVSATVGRKWVRVQELHRLRAKKVRREAWDKCGPQRMTSEAAPCSSI